MYNHSLDALSVSVNLAALYRSISLFPPPVLQAIIFCQMSILIHTLTNHAPRNNMEIMKRPLIATLNIVIIRIYSGGTMIYISSQLVA